MAKGKYHEWLIPEKLLIVEGWARDGLTDEQIAENIGIGVSTLYDWKNKFLEFSEALKKGKEVVDRQVENALLKKALGYEYKEIKIEENKGSYKKTTVIKHIPPDTTAQIFWLKNRKKDVWGDKKETESNIDLGQIIDMLEGLKNNDL